MYYFIYCELIFKLYLHKYIPKNVFSYYVLIINMVDKIYVISMDSARTVSYVICSDF